MHLDDLSEPAPIITDKNVNIMAFTSHARQRLRLRYSDTRRSKARQQTVKAIAALGIAYTIVPRDCLNDIDAPASQTRGRRNSRSALPTRGSSTPWISAALGTLAFSDLNVTGSTMRGLQGGYCNPGL